MKKVHNVLCACGRDYGATWGLKPKVVCWLHRNHSFVNGISDS